MRVATRLRGAGDQDVLDFQSPIRRDEGCDEEGLKSGETRDSAFSPLFVGMRVATRQAAAYRDHLEAFSPLFVGMRVATTPGARRPPRPARLSVPYSSG